MEIFTLPAVGLQNRNYFSFAGSFVKSLFAARKIFRQRRPDAVLAMGGFTSAPPILVAKGFGRENFSARIQHHSRPRQPLSFPLCERGVRRFSRSRRAIEDAQGHAHRHAGAPAISVGRGSDERLADARPARMHAADASASIRIVPTILVVGGSQGASGLNEMILSALPLLGSASASHITAQWLHLTGAKDFEKVKAAYAARGIKAVVKPFLAEMDLALGAATVAVSRAGASSLAEIAAMRLPALLVPFPAAADNHQFFNASAFEKTGAAKLLEQKKATPEKVAAILAELVENEMRAFRNAICPRAMARAARGGADCGNHFEHRLASRRGERESACKPTAAAAAAAHGRAKTRDGFNP